MTTREWGLLIFLSVLWGGSFFFNGVAVKELPTFTVVVSRVAIGALILYLVLRSMGQKMPTSPGVWRAFFCMGFMNNVVPFSLIVWGQSHIGSGVAAILNATTPVFAVIIAHWLTADEKMTRGRLFGVIVGFLGVAVMIGGDVFQSLDNNVIAQFACLGAGISYAFAGVFGRRFNAMGITPMATATGQVTAASVILVPVMLVVDTPWNLDVPGIPVVASLLGIAALSTALAYAIYFRILATAGATNLLLVTLLVPVSAIILGVFILDEVLLPKHLVGMLIIGFGLSAIDGRLWRWLACRAGLITKSAGQ
jgi:drug/metabolite transporter (DMT)-like permease